MLEKLILFAATYNSTGIVGKNGECITEQEDLERYLQNANSKQVIITFIMLSSFNDNMR